MIPALGPECEKGTQISLTCAFDIFSSSEIIFLSSCSKKTKTVHKKKGTEGWQGIKAK
jgi:hypothetical protein